MFSERLFVSVDPHSASVVLARSIFMLYYISSTATTTRYIEPELRTPPRRRPHSQIICAADRAPPRARPRLRRTSVGSAHVRHDRPLRLRRASVNQVFERPERAEAQFPRWVDGRRRARRGVATPCPGNGVRRGEHWFTRLQTAAEHDAPIFIFFVNAENTAASKPEKNSTSESA